MTAGESITLRVAQALEDCGIPFLLSGYIEDWCQRIQSTAARAPRGRRPKNAG